MTKVAKQSLILCAGSMFLLIFSSVSEAGDCYTDCVNSSNCSSLSSDHNSAYCGDAVSRCQMTCLQKTDDSHDSYGAIAYSVKNNAYGFSDSWKDKKEAQKAAMKYCSQNGKGCKNMVWFRNSCGAVASDGKKASWGYGPSIQAAQKQALDNCNKGFSFGFFLGLYFKKHCEVKVSHCS